MYEQLTFGNGSSFYYVNVNVSVVGVRLQFSSVYAKAIKIRQQTSTETSWIPLSCLLTRDHQTADPKKKIPQEESETETIN